MKCDNEGGVKIRMVETLKMIRFYTFYCVFGHRRILLTYNGLVPVMRLPTVPIAIISIPFIRSTSDRMTANSGAPKPIGCAIMRPDITILSIPTPMRKALAHPEIP